jgi:pimeloyl-ACP methyl ester carboxylesterase
MVKVAANGVEIEYERTGPASGEAVLLIHGLSAQLSQWPAGFHGAIAAAGYSVIRYDSRDVGLSTHLDDAGVPDVAAAIAARRRGEEPRIPYSVDDLADDAAALLEALGVEKAHVLGVSLGGQVVQSLAIRHPDRVRTLTVVMSYAGNPDVPPNNPAVLMTPLPDPAEDEDGYVAGHMAVLRAIGSPGYPWRDEDLRAFSRDAVRRAYYPAGVMRQLAAGRSAPDRREGLRALAVPTLVIHGVDDPLIPFAAGEDVARNTPGAFLLAISGMGHDLPPQLDEPLADAFIMNARRARH